MNNYDQALHIVLFMLKGQEVTSALIRAKSTEVVKMLTSIDPADAVDVDRLCRDIESRCNVWIGDATILENREDHQIWLPDRRASIDWRFWRRYRRYLEETQSWSETLVNKLDNLTDKILEQVEDPVREGAWDRRGVVAGHIQSGKTANYIGLICKAADAGYRLIIVLAGMHKSLRSQTQIRIDEGFLGYDTRLAENIQPENVRIGVGAFADSEFLYVRSLTNSQDDGDFRRAVADRPGMLPGGNEPPILVVKKNKSVLRNVLNWARHVVGSRDKTTGKVIVRDIPLLLIDDEADNASINTNPIPIDPDTGSPLEDYDVTAINGLIRQLLSSFEKSAYIGYTATPFANIFICPDEAPDSYGEDLFPRSFIVNLPAPSNYVGPSTVFGLDGDEDAGIEGQDGLPLVRYIVDHEEYIPDKHNKDHIPLGLPLSMKLAIRFFIISCAARMARGEEHNHNSILIHVTRFNAVQRIIFDMVSDELGQLRRRLEFGDGAASKKLLDEFEEIWHSDYVPTTKAVKQNVDDPLMVDITWNDVAVRLYPAISRVQLKLINGSAGDILDYRDHKNGMSVITIGGEKLSRGLTLEGLSISYYLRASKMYDTLMQMGRWFGFRPGYLDLCRVFTSHELAEWYKYISLANEELRREFDYMSDIGKTPADYGLKVRTHPDGLLVTAVNKMRSGTEMELSFAGEVSETTIFDKNPEILRQNLRAAGDFIAKLGEPQAEKRANRLWYGVSTELILGLLSAFSIHRDSRKANPDLLSDYISMQLSQGELTHWTVGLISQPKGLPFSLAGLTVGLTKRAQADPSDTRYCLNKGRLLSPPDEGLDLDENEWPKESSGDPVKKPTPEQLRFARPKTRGLLLIYLLDNEHVVLAHPVPGLFFSFPFSPTAKSIKYKVNNVYWEQEFAAQS